MSGETYLVLKILDSRKIFEEKGYSFIYKEFPGSEPEYVNLRFEDIVKELSRLDIGKLRLYRHQYKGYLELSKGYNIILRSGTGSGKTETWILYLLSRLVKGEDIRVLAIYPTLALANDQIRRIRKYLSVLNKEPLQLDSVKRVLLKAKLGSKGLIEKIGTSNVIVTNPAFLLHDLKKLVISQGNGLLSGFLRKLDMIVIDELDFYGPRSTALLLAMLKLLAKYTEKKLQVVVLTATLANPDDLGKYLYEITGRDYRVIYGKPFMVSNRLFIVLGKNLRQIWEQIKKCRDSIPKTPEYSQVVEALSSYEKFQREAYKIVLILQALGYEIPSLSVDIKEILKSYLWDEGVTLVFTKSIARAEEIVRELKAEVGENASIASHHHLISKEKREAIEEGARRGVIKIIVSPRTLSQGINIGTITRIVHIGLPDNVREFYQREGRKGRTRDIPFTETIIIPCTRWDRDLLSKGIEAFFKWLDMGLEKTIINPENLYIHLFTGLAKLKSPWLGKRLEELEEKALRSVGVLTEKGVNEKLLNWIYERMNFYEFAPPYGIKRYLIKDDKVVPLEPIGHCDLVEKFQPGCIDYSEEALVLKLETGKTTRYVKAVYEKPYREINFYANDALSVALEEYRYIKMKWGEKPNILRDLITGRISSEELCVVYTPSKGFGSYRKIPDRCIWTVRSEKPRIIKTREGIVVFYDRKQIYVPMPTGGEYRDYTYGFKYDVDPKEDASLMRLSLALLMIILRRKLGIPFETIMYDVVKVGETKYFSLHEPEAAGIITGLQWDEVRRIVEKYEPDELDSILLSEIDEIAYADLVRLGFNWNVVKQYALRMIDYILLREKIKLIFKGKEILIPKPSKALRLLSLSIMSEIIDNPMGLPYLVIGIGVFDGEEENYAVAVYPPVPYVKPPREIMNIEHFIVERVLYDNNKVIVTGKEQVIKMIKQGNLKGLLTILESGIIDLSELGKEKGIEPFSITPILEQIGYRYEGVESSRILEDLKSVREKGILREREKERIGKYLINEAKKQYFAYLVLNSIK